ncbi:conserved protein of unknown function [Xenorhabdus poinarii G6]|uniref:MepB protein n=1 Tax=Xenorhabdus poinarii G6 TaxID=1354304 RepID=A0A068QY91_9GAMM|nr:MepB family protein [Xenorhabdus poinarii]CDG20027.1 conserved protein of unknown function [Xenorhabdus poinarii G6]
MNNIKIEYVNVAWVNDALKDDIPHSFKAFVETILEPIASDSVSHVQRDIESDEYGALSFDFNGKRCLFRQAKTTPTKVGQFVTIWKRDTLTSEIAPFHINDGIDIVVIASFDHEQKGYFIFNNELLGNKGVFTKNGKQGKRAIRVYAPWVKTMVKQAINTQQWQRLHFVQLSNNSETLVNKAKLLLNKGTI